MKIGEYEITWYQVLAVALTILFFYMVIMRILGHSATNFTLLITASGTLVTWMYSLEHRFSALNREVGEMHINMKNSFNNAKRDMDELKLLIKRRK